MAHDLPCPRCSCTATLRVHRMPKEYVLLGYRAFFCMDCRHRFLRFEFAKLLRWETMS